MVKSKYRKGYLELLEYRAIIDARRSFFFFMKYMFPFKVTWNWHHEYVCGVLERFVKSKEAERLMIFMPPQHQKSTMMTEYLPAYTLGIKPNQSILLTMYNETKAAEYNRKVQRVIDNEKYAKIFPETRLNTKNIVTNAKGNYVRNSSMFEIVGKRGFFKSVGLGSGIAGTPAKLALMDDVIKSVEEAYSATYRNKTYNWYTDELEARLHNDSKVAFTITRRHEDDLAGRLIERDGIRQEGGKWEVIVLPALKEHHNNTNDIRKNIGDALFPQLHSKERLEEIRDNNSRTFASLYQQRPAPEEGEKVKKAWFQYCHEKEVPGNIVFDLWIDGAYTKSTANDPTGLMIAGYDELTQRLYIKHAHHAYLEMPELLKLVPEYANLNGLNNLSRTYLEPKASGKTLKQMLIVSTNMNAVEIKSTLISEGKEARIQVAAPKIEAGRVTLVKGSWNDKFVSQICTFPAASHDEYVDLIGYACDHYYNKKIIKKRRVY